ncbi:MAG TPA: amidohydrolase [Candidatus Syntrophoarchaeum butanivorans]|uniref:Amidohydrolase n=1 Tax=Candidatus Syntropharchaeum butanivorans TaxID=1839936 RepID=A0A1F2P875_9EURY|nr:MAG: nucleoside deaminase [Candidatus Syntrophoarchaeum butanivorans]HEC57743.1 amidohydrolase [Candidatus Syntrophoarchaeum butanivorans]
MSEVILAGTIIYGEDLEVLTDSYLVVEKGIIKEVGSGSGVDAVIDGIIIPGLVNAHTHIGDSFFKDPPHLPLDELVKPPHGLKHRLLADIDRETLIDSMRVSIMQMIRSGISLFADFREGGSFGAEALRAALSGMNIESLIFGREEVAPDVMDGIGVSGAGDSDPEELLKMRERARELGMPFAIHAGEIDGSDIDDALDLHPDHVVHMVHADTRHIRRMADLDIPLVICIRSNLLTGVGIPPLLSMLDTGILTGIGTDNVMLNSPDVLTEMEFLSKVYRLDDREVLRMATINGRKILADPGYCGIMEGRDADITVISRKSLNMQGFKDPVRSVVRRATASDIIACMRKDRVEVF